MNAAGVLKLRPSCSRLDYMSAAVDFTEMYKKSEGSGYSLCESELYLSTVNCSLLASRRTKVEKNITVVLMAAGREQFFLFFWQGIQALHLNLFFFKIKEQIRPKPDSQTLWLWANDNLTDVSWCQQSYDYLAKLILWLSSLRIPQCPPIIPSGKNKKKQTNTLLSYEAHPCGWRSYVVCYYGNTSVMKAYLH